MRAKAASKKIGTPYLFLQPMKLATSNLVHNLGLKLAYQKTTFRTKIGGGVGQGSIKRNLGLLQPLKLATSNLVHKLGSGLAYQKTTFSNKIGGGLGEGCIQNSWDPYLFLQPLKLATSNLVCNLGVGLSYQKTSFRTKIGGGGGGGAGPGEHPKKNLGPPIYFCNR